MTQLPQNLIASMQTLLAEAYEAGLADGLKRGAEQMRSAILIAAQAPIDIPRTAVATSYFKLQTKGKAEVITRAPHGSVRKAISAALRSANNGLSEIDVGIEANRSNPLVSARSVGGELRRMRDRLYRFDGGRWFLIANGEMETAGDNPAVPQPQATQEASDDSETAIAA